MLRLGVLSALIIASVTGVATSFATPASAAPICEEVWTTGTLVGYHLVGDCVPYVGSTTCTFPDAGLDPSAHLWAEFCVPH